MVVVNAALAQAVIMRSSGFVRELGGSGAGGGFEAGGELATKCERLLVWQ